MLLKVLIVEDEEIIRKGLVFAINWIDWGCIIAGAAKDGAEGLRMIEEQKPDVVLTDIRMPKMSGLEMIKAGLSKHSFYSIVLTSYSEFELAKQALRIGVTDYLLKPVDEEELGEVLEKIRKRIRDDSKVKKIEQISQDRILTENTDWKIFEIAENSMDTYVRETYEIIKNHYTEKISINTVAEELGVSASFLSRRLKSNLGATFVDILNQYRVKRAIHLLKKGTMRIYEISDDLGFSEYKYFCSVFKRYTGTNPTDFVKQGGSTVVFEKREENDRKTGEETVILPKNG